MGMCNISAVPNILIINPGDLDYELLPTKLS